MSESTEERRFCTSCGAPLRADNEFCTSCGKPAQSTERVVTPPVTQTSDTNVQGGESSIAAAKNLFERLGSWVRGLPKWVFVAAGILVLLVVLSPITSRLALVAVIVLIVILVVQVVRRQPIGLWARAAGAALVLAVGLLVASSALYGGGGSEIGSSGGIGGESASERQYGVSGGSVAKATECNLLGPQLRPVAEEWASQDPDEVSGTLYLPTYVPFEIESVESGSESEYLWEIKGEGEGIALELEDYVGYMSSMPDEMVEVNDAMLMDGEIHPYIVEREDPYLGYYVIVFGEGYEGEEIPLQLRLSYYTDLGVAPDITPEGVSEMFASMVSIEPGDEC